MSDNTHKEEAHPKLTINPQELTPGSILVATEMEESENTDVMSHKAKIQAHGHGDGTKSDFTPMELLLSSLGLCITKTLKLVIKQREMAVPRFAVALSQERQNDKTVIRCEIVVDAHLNEAGREFLKDGAAFCPTAQLLNADIESEIIIS